MSPDCDIESLACRLRDALELNRSCRHLAELCRVRAAEDEGNAEDSSELILIGIAC